MGGRSKWYYLRRHLSSKLVTLSINSVILCIVAPINQTRCGEGNHRESPEVKYRAWGEILLNLPIYTYQHGINFWNKKSQDVSWCFPFFREKNMVLRGCQSSRDQVEGLGDELLWAWRGLTPLALALLHGRGDVALMLVRRNLFNKSRWGKWFLHIPASVSYIWSNYRYYSTRPGPLKGSWGSEFPKFQGSLGLSNIWPDISFLGRLRQMKKVLTPSTWHLKDSSGGWFMSIHIFTIPKYPDPSKVPILRTRTPAIQVPTPPLEGPRILRDLRIFIL